MFTASSHRRPPLVEMPNESKGTTPIPFVRYGSGDSARDVVIIDGQPYYKSTGMNSGSKGTWFPFIMMVGTKVRECRHPLLIPNELDQGGCEYFFPKKMEKVAASYFLKGDPDVLNPRFNQITQFNSITRRLSTKRDLVNSLRLGDGMWSDARQVNQAMSQLSYAEEKIANDPIILQAQACMVTQNPDEINAWLLANGATTINKLFELNEIPKSNTNIETHHSRQRKKIKRMLSKYIELRQKEQEKIYSFFYDMGNYPCSIKFSAVNKLINWLDGRTVKFSQVEFNALNEGRLDNIFSEIMRTEFYKRNSGKMQVQHERRNDIHFIQLGLCIF